MKVMKHNDEVIRSFSTFKKYNNELTEILAEKTFFRKPKGFTEKIFCGTFTAKVYIGQQIFGTYRFDCTDFDRNNIPDNAQYRVSKVS